MKTTKFIPLILMLSLLLNICAGCTASGTSTPSEDQELISSKVVSVWIPPYLPGRLDESIHLPEEVIELNNPDIVDMRIDVGSDRQISQWVFALVAPFPTIMDEVTLQDLKTFWLGVEGIEFPTQNILVDGSTQILFTKLWGNPSVQNVESASANELLKKAWQAKTSWAIIPFEQLNPQWKVIAVDGQSPIHKDFSPASYGLNVPFSLFGKAEIVDPFFIEYFQSTSQSPILESGNYEPVKMTILAMTGVTALVGGTASMMERLGMTYPAMDIGPILRDADITHISNEVSFFQNCAKPSLISRKDLIFCSRPDYIQLLEAIGTDVVELTGDHFIDYGPGPMLYTLELYENRGWGYYGGGRNLEEAQKPLLINHNENRLAFLGCNAKLPGYAKASDSSPGAAYCDMDVMIEKIHEVKEQGYLPIVSFQHVEYYSYEAKDALIKDFHQMAEQGAIIVSGSQAHQPHAMEFYRNAFLHYGLGNLFFDQYYEGEAQRQAFIDRHVFYENKHISTELITIRFIDLSRTRLMTKEERQELLSIIYSVSGW